MIRKGWLSLLLLVTLSGSAARADWSVDLFGPHGRVSFGDRDYVEYGGGGSYGGYHDVLDGYGRWVYLPGTGECWIPHVATSWRPYLYGRWVWCDYGWTWVSYEPWGYFPHHYGDWRYVGNYGWCWMPGYTWRPANVTFCHRGGYVGWYPTGAFIDIDININIYNHLSFVRTRDFTSHRLDRVVLGTGPTSPVHALAQGFVKSRNVLSAPPSLRTIEGAARAKVERVAFDERNVKVGGRNLKVVAPKGAARQNVLEQAREVAPKVVTKVDRKAGSPAGERRGAPTASNRPSKPEPKGRPSVETMPNTRPHTKPHTKPRETADTGRPAPSVERGKVTPREQVRREQPRSGSRELRPRSEPSVRKESPKPAPRESVRSPKPAPRESVRSPKPAPRESVRSPKPAPRESVRSPKPAPRESVREPRSSPRESVQPRRSVESRDAAKPQREGKAKRSAPAEEKPADAKESGSPLKGPKA